MPWAREKAKFPPEVYTREFEEQTLNDCTVNHIFGHQLRFSDDVLYRPRPRPGGVVNVDPATCSRQPSTTMS
jgi:hypothetical protein